MAELEKKYLDHIQFTGKKADGTKAEKQNLYFKDSEARETLSGINNEIENLNDHQPTQRALTISADAWQGDSAPYIYDFGKEYADRSVIVGFNQSEGTEGQLYAAQIAVIVGGSDTKIYATGEKPAVDIPVIVQFS